MLWKEGMSYSSDKCVFIKPVYIVQEVGVLVGKNIGSTCTVDGRSKKNENKKKSNSGDSMGA
jgi:hypothetical protein